MLVFIPEFCFLTEFLTTLKKPMGQQGLLEAKPDFFLIIVFIRQTGAFVFRVYMSLTPASG